jgi:ABC-2 type transport system ATP-binding protein
MTATIEATALGKKYGRRWALQNCSLTIPSGRVVGLVGPNGAGKSTLLHLAVGLLQPSAGSLSVLGEPPASSPTQLSRIGFLAQESPTYARLSIDQHLQMGQWMNPRWDAAYAVGRIEQLGLNPKQRSGTLSGGQRSQLALTLAVAKRPELLILDEPVAALDPLARREFLQTLMEVVAERGVSVILSSHLITDLDRVCDYLIVLDAGQVALAGDLEDLVASHFRLTGPLRDPLHLPSGQTVIEASNTEKQTTLIVHSDGPVIDPSWTVTPLTLDDLVLAYMRRARDGARPHSLGLAVTQ